MDIRSIHQIKYQTFVQLIAMRECFLPKPFGLKHGLEADVWHSVGCVPIYLVHTLIASFTMCSRFMFKIGRNFMKIEYKQF